MIGRKLIVPSPPSSPRRGRAVGLYCLRQGPSPPPQPGKTRPPTGIGTKPPAEPEAAANAPEAPRQSRKPTRQSRPRRPPTDRGADLRCGRHRAERRGRDRRPRGAGLEGQRESEGTKVAEAKADLQGEWSVVLEKPLSAGDHALSLKITSPDGTRALSSQNRCVSRSAPMRNRQARRPA